MKDGCLKICNWFVYFFTIISTRVLIEFLIFNFSEDTPSKIFIFWLHTFLFFLLIYWTFFFLLKFLTKEKDGSIGNVLNLSFILILLPPIIDKIFFKNDFYYSFYLLDNLKGLVIKFFQFFGKEYDFGITIGSRVVVFFVILGISGFIYKKTKNFKKGLIGLVVSYFIFFIFSAAPSLVVFLIKGINVNATEIAGILFSPFELIGFKETVSGTALSARMSLVYFLLLFVLVLVYFFKTNQKQFTASIKNLRFPQLFFNVGLFFIGLLLGFFYNDYLWSFDFFDNLVLIVLVLNIGLAWYFSVIVNDLNDFKIDQITNQERPLIKKDFTRDEYKTLGLIIFLFSFFGFCLISLKIALIMICYYLLVYSYSSKPGRLKQFILISNLLISFSSLLFLIIGYLLVSGREFLINFPWEIYWFLFGAYFLVIPVKDIKDLVSDKKYKITTLPILIGEENTRLIIAVFLFSFYLSSVYLLKKPQLFFWALFFGSISFFVINSKKISNKKLNYWVLSLVFLYGVTLVKIIFY